MVRPHSKITNSLQRLLDLFNEIEDEDIREIISNIVVIESKHRSSSRETFPWKDVRSEIDKMARLKEEREKQEVK
ncbi:MAG: hypothetical protein FOGNACKC_02898 [Anaerolineae bacterium]|nr:hypothetical protein [Anaerolineae bacterium]